ncbi:hypothetical protein [Donghicola mangrovi]|uniref:Uncharacterized protein n=1 Tax=Donghicola mangrovi TaxID=2729614 RepID=A0A850QDG0_9RHOB|nr:hypothetical protein [Donghicola mangrovi]NVO24465.1 hypothetical protein [Donghicola mangrovi]
MLAKLFWTVAVTLAAMSATYVDGQKNFYELADQSLNLYFSGFGAIIVGLIVNSSTRNSQIVVEVSANKLMVSFFALFFIFLVIIILGQQRNPSAPSYVLSFARTCMGTCALGVGLMLAESFLLKENVEDA